MANMCTVVYCKTDGNDIVDDCYAVKGDVPVVKESKQEEVDKCDAQEDK